MNRLLIVFLIVSPIIYIAANLGTGWAEKMAVKHPRLSGLKYVIGYGAFLFFTGFLLAIVGGIGAE